jgi:hypothetical protein
MAQKPEERLSALDNDHQRIALEDHDIKLNGIDTKQFEKLTNGIDPVAWQTHMKTALEGVAGPVKSFKMEITHRSYGFEVKCHIRTETTKINLERTFDTDHGTVHHDYQKIESRVAPVYDREAQGGGKSRALFKASAELYDNMGMKKIDVSAALTVGGYSWARYGFIPDRYSWDNLRTLVGDKIRASRDPEAKRVLGMIQASSDPKSIRVLAALKIPSGNEEGDTVGQQVLKGSSWNGSIDLTNTHNYSLMRAYLESKKGD